MITRCMQQKLADYFSVDVVKDQNSGKYLEPNFYICTATSKSTRMNQPVTVFDYTAQLY